MGKPLKRKLSRAVPGKARPRLLPLFSKKPLSSNYLIVLSTVPNGPTARRLAKLLVSERWAACVNVMGGVQSIYRWKGAVESAREYLLIAKTTRRRFAALQARLAAAHPYEVPEIMAVPLADGLAQYFSWISENTSPLSKKARSR
ncbi:MAG: divalent-cation tolerance protein CutA [Elusimicrobia bacterium]|nr:divalent-cation tolerance protein CutA [Elusimicrobiota bacterium]MBP9698800.1 divalent-cation tolerance protein CutA [Elusimicrobiota bacterium]